MPNYDLLRNILQTRLSVIADTELRDSDPSEQLRQLQQASEALSQWQADNKGLPAQLNHFLKQSSLSKALDYINNL